MHLLTLLVLPMIGLTAASPMAWDFLWCLKDGNGGAVYMCSGPDFSGQCEYRKPNDDCFAPSFVPQSIGPDRGGYCVMYQDRECKGNLVVLDAQTVDGKVVGFTRVQCPGIASYPESLPKVGSMQCGVGT